MNPGLLGARENVRAPWRRGARWRLRVRVGPGLGLACLSGLAVLSLGLGFALGAAEPGPARLLVALAHGIGWDVGAPLSELERAVVWQLRAPRVLLGAGVGAVLALCGAVMQALFRNPLVEPGLVGTSTGAALGAVLWISAGGVAGGVATAGAAFLGALLSTGLVLVLAGGGSGALLLLAGVALSACWSAGIGWALFHASDAALRDVTFWTLGSLARATWTSLGWAAVGFAIALGGLAARTRLLDALLLGESAARSLGHRVDRERLWLVLLCALGVGSAVAWVGPVGFVGLLAPHGARLILGGSHRYLLPGSALLGAALAVSCDAIARVAVAPAELPLGVVTAAAGGPCFLALLWSRRGRVQV